MLNDHRGFTNCEINEQFGRRHEVRAPEGAKTYPKYVFDQFPPIFTTASHTHVNCSPKNKQFLSGYSLFYGSVYLIL